MTRSIQEWQKASFELARMRGEHTRECPQCRGRWDDCAFCSFGRVDVDHKSPTRIASRLALIHLSISRAVECVVKGEMSIRQQLNCPRCDYRHVDHDEWAMRLHHTHLCCFCGWLWRVEYYAFGSGDDEPQGFPIALVDVFLRLCELAEGLGIRLPEFVQYQPDGSCDRNNPESLLCEPQGLHWSLDQAWHPSRFEPVDAVQLRDFTTSLYVVAGACGIDLLAMAEFKYAFNQTLVGKPRSRA